MSVSELNVLKDQIDSHYGLFLEHLTQSDEATLVLTISEARVNQDKVHEWKFNEGTELEKTLSGNLIETDDSCKRYRITFEYIVAHQSVDESYISWSDDETFEGKLIREFSRSRYLEHAAEHLSLAHYQDMTGKKYRHFQVVCLNFVVDILGPNKPLIEEIAHSDL